MMPQEDDIRRFLDGTLPEFELDAVAGRIQSDRDFAARLVSIALIDDLLKADASHTWAASFDGNPAGQQARPADFWPIAGDRKWDVANPPRQSDGNSAPSGDRNHDARSPWVRRLQEWMAPAVTLLIVCGFLWSQKSFFQTPVVPRAEPPVLGEVTRSINTRWMADAVPYSLGSRLKEGDVIALATGELGVHLDSGADLVIRGPANLELVSDRLLSIQLGTVSGQISPDEEEEKVRWSISTPAADMKRIRANFQLGVTEDETTIAITSGHALVKARDRQLGKTVTRGLEASEGVSIDLDGNWNPLNSVSSSEFIIHRHHKRVISPTRPPVLLEVYEEGTSVEHPRFYPVIHEGLQEDSPAYVDRYHEWNGLDAHGMPEFLLGADYVQTFNSDKETETPVLHVQIAGPAWLYVFYDDRAKVPAWLVQNFEDTGSDIGLDEDRRSMSQPPQSLGTGPGVSVNRILSVWRRRVDGNQSVQLGQVEMPIESPFAKHRLMYGVAAQPIHEAPAE